MWGGAADSNAHHKLQLPRSDCLSSAAMCVLLQAAVAAGYGGIDHETILKATKTPEGAVDFFVELHIEQGPLLEKVRQKFELASGNPLSGNGRVCAGGWGSSRRAACRMSASHFHLRLIN